VADLISASVLAVNDGYRVRNSELGIEGTPFVRGGDIGQNGEIDTSVSDRVLPQFKARLNGKFAIAEDVAFISKGTVGRVGRLRHGQPEVVFAPQVCFWRALDREKLCPTFLYYVMTDRGFQSQLDAVRTHGSMVADYVSLGDQKSFRLRLPSIAEQRSIGAVLGALDDKIEQNRRTSRKLEELARGMFKAWFVDFEPVHAKAAGATSYPGMPAAAFNALPISFVNSELGEIPERWSVADVYELSDVIYGAPFKSKLFNSDRLGLPLIRIRDLQSHLPEVFTTEMHPKGTRVRPADIIVGMDGEFRLHYWTGPEAWLNQRLCMFKPRKSVSPVFLGESLRAPLDYVERSEAATTVIHLGKYDIDRFRMIRPIAAIMDSFAALTDPLLELKVRAASESRKLAELRDYLLPKLLSGQVRVKDAEKIVAGNGL